jgi:hypothetical protein
MKRKHREGNIYTWPIYERIYQRIKFLILKKTIGNKRWIDITGEEPEWVERKINKLNERRVRLPNKGIHNQKFIIQGRYSLYIINYSNTGEKYRVLRKRKENQFSTWEQIRGT